MKNDIIKCIINLFKLEKENQLRIEKETKNDLIKNIRNLFKSEKETKPMKGKIFSDIRNLFEQEEDYYKPITVSNFYSNIYKCCCKNYKLLLVCNNLLLRIWK